MQPKHNEASLPVVPEPVHRRSGEVGIGGFVRDLVKPILVTKLSALSGYVAGRVTPPSVVSSLAGGSKDKLAMLGIVTKEGRINPVNTGMLAGVVAGIYEAYHHWKKGEAKRLGVTDIHKDVLSELDPRELQKQTEQNERIQAGMAELAGIRPRGSYTQALAREAESRPVEVAASR